MWRCIPPLVAVCVFAATLSAQNPAPTITSRSVTPATACPNETISVSMTARNGGGSSPEAYLSMSFPRLTGSTDASRVSITCPSGFTAVRKNPGQTIYRANGTSMTAQYVLAECYGTWAASASKTVTATVSAAAAGTFEVYLRTTMMSSGGTAFNYPNGQSSYYDQQNWQVFRHVVTIPGTPGSFTLSSPSNGADFASGTNSVTLSWNTSSGATSYHVFFGPGSDPPYYTETPNTTKSVPVSDGTSYSWNVRAATLCATKWSSSSDRTFSVDEPCYAPGSFNNISPANGYVVDPAATSFVLIWGKASNATSYDLYFGSGPLSSPYATIQQSECSTDCRREVPIAYDTTYNWRVVARNGCGDTSSSSGTWQFTNPPMPVRDLVASMVSVTPGSPIAGTDVTASYTTTNNGNSSAGASVTKLWLSADTSIDAGDVFICSQSVPSLGPNGASTPGSCDWTIPPSTTIGTWYVIAQADANDSVSESREDNNTSAYAIGVIPPPSPPDLEATSITVSPSGPWTPETFLTITGRITNIGGDDSGPFNWVLRIDGLPVDSGYVDGLAPGGFASESSIRWSGRLNAGTHVVRLDATTATGEIETANNERTHNVEIGSGTPLNGTTVITSGAQSGTCPMAWTHDLASRIRHRRGSGSILFYDKATGTFSAAGRIGEDCTSLDESLGNSAGESILIFDWAAESFSLGQGYSEAAGEALAAALIHAATEGTISLDGVHFIGHSRGTVVNSEAAERLLAAGYDVAQLTTLDPHDWGSFLTHTDYDVNRARPEYPPKRGVLCWSSAGECDNYFQDGSLLLHGRHVDGARNVDLSEKSGMDHLGVVTWYEYTAIGSDVVAEEPPDWFGDPACPSPAVCCVDDRTATRSRIEEGYATSVRMETEPWCDVIGGDSTAVRFEWSREGIVNGDFDRALPDGPIPGWELHATEPAAQTADAVSLGVVAYNTVLRLLPGQGRTHNRFFAPPEATAIAFRYAVNGADAARSLEVTLGGEPASTYSIATSGQCGFNGTGCTWIDAFAPIPAARRGTVITDLRFSLPSGGFADVYVDDVRLVSGGLAAPRSLEAERLTATSVRLTWLDATSSETGFTVERRVSNGAWTEAGTMAAAATRFTDSDLTACETYEYRVYAFAASARSPFSNLASIETGGCPLDAPADVSASPLSDTSIRVQWTDIANEIGYGVEWRPSTAEEWVPAVQTDADVTSLDLGDLTPCTTYAVRVYAFDGDVASAYSPEVTATTTGCSALPNAPSGVFAGPVSSTALIATWEDESNNESGFLVEIRPYDSGTWAEALRTSAGARAAQVSDLAECTRYVLRVRAFNSAGSSDPSNEVEVATLGCITIPDPPGTLRAYPSLGGSAVELSWIDNSSIETGFTIERKSGAEGEWIVIGTAAANATQFVDEAPVACATSFYRVFAFSDAGSSSPSNEATVIIGACPAPGALSVNPNACDEVSPGTRSKARPAIASIARRATCCTTAHRRAMSIPHVRSRRPIATA